MKLALAAAVLTVVAVPITVQGAQAPSKAPPVAKRTCTVSQTLGSRVNNVRRCRTADEREQEKQEARRVVDRVQAMKPVMCIPPRPC